jgi:N-acetylneuraminate synthase
MGTKGIYVIAELGINHGGSLETAHRMIDVAKECGVNAVKFQKRTVAHCYTPEELAKPRESMYGTTNGDLKYGLELGRAAYDDIDQHCKQIGLAWSASCWDSESVAFMAEFNPPWLKIPSALITDLTLLQSYKDTRIPLYLSTGMSTEEEVDTAMQLLGAQATPLACTSTYPCPASELNLLYIRTLISLYGVAGFSSHCVSPWPVLGAVGLGASVIEAHLTLDRTLWGSDQSSSLEPKAFKKLVEEIRTLEVALGTGEKVVYPSEEPIKAKLRRVHV